MPENVMHRTVSCRGQLPPGPRAAESSGPRRPAGAEPGTPLNRPGAGPCPAAPAARLGALRRPAMVRALVPSGPVRCRTPSQRTADLFRRAGRAGRPRMPAGRAGRAEVGPLPRRPEGPGPPPVRRRPGPPSPGAAPTPSATRPAPAAAALSRVDLERPACPEVYIYIHALLCV